MPRSLALMIGLALCAGGCTDPVDNPGPADAGGDGPRVCDPALCTDGVVGVIQVGEGVEDPENPGLLVYRELHDGDRVTIVQGFQGGQHVWVMVRGVGVGTCYVTPHYVLADDDGAALDATWGGEFYPVPGDDDELEFLAYAAFVSEPERVHGKEVTLSVDVSDGCGHLVTDAVRVTPIDPRLGEPGQ